MTDTGDKVEFECSIVNEFAAVIVRKIRTGNGERLEVSSPSSGHSIRLDALALEGLSWQRPDVISGYLEEQLDSEDGAAEAGHD